MKSFHPNFNAGDLSHLGENFKNMKFDFHFDTTAFNMGMKELRRSLKKLKINPYVFLYKNEFPGCNMDAFKEGMKNFDKELKHNRLFNEDFMIDMSEFKKNMENFHEKMKNFDFNMKSFEKNKKILKCFLKDLKHALVTDSLIKEEGENFSMKFNSKEMIINGNKVSGILLKKYKELYRRHYGKEIDDEFNINNITKDDNNLNEL